MKKPHKPIPDFHNEDEERAFWATHDSSEYLDWSEAQRIKLPNLKPSTKSVSIRLPLWLLEDLKIQANRRDVPYQSYMKMLLAEAVKQQDVL